MKLSIVRSLPLLVVGAGLVVGLAGCAGDAPGDGMAASTDGTRPASVEYRLTFEPMWNAETHPLEYPKAGLLSGPHFSGLIGTTHDAEYALVRAGQPPSPGLERLAEQGKHDPLDAEIRQAIASGHAGMLFETGPVKDFSMPATASFRADAAHPRVSVVAMIAPSPDWFAAAADVELMEGGAWVASRTVTVYAWDAGGDLGTSYEAADADADPKQPMRLNDAPHFLKDGARVPVGRLTLEKR